MLFTLPLLTLFLYLFIFFSSLSVNTYNGLGEGLAEEGVGTAYKRSRRRLSQKVLANPALLKSSGKIYFHFSQVNQGLPRRKGETCELM